MVMARSLSMRMVCLLRELAEGEVCAGLRKAHSSMACGIVRESFPGHGERISLHVYRGKPYGIGAGRSGTVQDQKKAAPRAWGRQFNIIGLFFLRQTADLVFQDAERDIPACRSPVPHFPGLFGEKHAVRLDICALRGRTYLFLPLPGGRSSAACPSCK